MTTRQSMTIIRSFAVSQLFLLLLLFLRDGECAAPRVTFSKAKSCSSFHKSVDNKEESKRAKRAKSNDDALCFAYNAHRLFTIHQVFTHANKYN